MMDMEINEITQNVLMDIRANQFIITEINPEIIKETLEQLMCF